MDKDIYDLLNNIKTDADEKLANNEVEELSDFETKMIMSKLSSRIKANATENNSDNSNETETKTVTTNINDKASNTASGAAFTDTTSTTTSSAAFTDTTNTTTSSATFAGSSASDNIVPISKKSNRKKFIPFAIGLAAALALSVSFWAWKNTNKTDDSSSYSVASEDSSEDITTEISSEAATDLASNDSSNNTSDGNNIKDNSNEKSEENKTDVASNDTSDNNNSGSNSGNNSNSNSNGKSDSGKTDVASNNTTEGYTPATTDAASNNTTEGYTPATTDAASNETTSDLGDGSVDIAPNDTAANSSGDTTNTASDDIIPSDDNTPANDTAPTTEKHDFSLICAYMKDPNLVINADSASNNDFNVSIWNAHGNGDMNFTRMLFSVTGDNISSLHLSIDKCSLYIENPTDIDPEEFLYSGKTLDEWGIDVTPTKTWAIFDPYGVTESIDIVEVIGNDFTTSYSPNQKFGFYIPIESINSVISSEELEETLHYDWMYHEPVVNLLRDAKLTVDVTYNDGTTLTKKYNVHPGNLKYFTSSAGYRITTTEFAAQGEDSEFGIVLELLDE
ncbi:MAG: hypothetical protein K6E10_03930 [Eubacterium sp.]|nr:hypothetical protein [Eubacterium sp.]